MTNSRVSACIVGTIVALFGSVAAAQELTPTVAADTSLGESSTMRLGVVLSPMPAGTLKGTAFGVTDSADTKFAFGIMPTFDFSLNQFLFVGLAPQYIFNVKPDQGDADSAQELDLRARIGGIAKVADTIRVFGYAAPGYSIIMLPDSADGIDNPAGFVLGFAAGAAFDLAPSTYLTGEIGYQVGYQSTKLLNNDVDFKTNYLHVGVGLGFRL
jgi:Outer membrane protein beta-barrel domain